MRAVVVSEQGGPEVLRVEDREVPEPGDGQVRVDVQAAGVNYIDIYQRSGTYPMQTPFVAGSEGAGTVSAIGPGVADVAVGDLVAWAMVSGAGYAEQVVLAADKVVPVPDGVSGELAAAVLLQGMTAHYLVESTFPAQAGQTALVHAAAGGVGLLLCQMLAAKGVRVIGTTSTPEKAELARSAGAAEIVFYRDVDLVTEVERLTDGAGVDVVYDGVGKATFDAGLEVLRPRGTMVLFGGASGPVPPIDPQVLNAKGSLFLTRPSLAHYAAEREELLQRAADVLGQVAAGRLDVRIGGRYPLADAAQAQTDLASGGTTGKLLLVI
ncbi:quinone oxidoreductase family protein [Ornithinimicrobium cryptoxanthini]|uniref:Quinone oxidoreductase n=1 Tax=Ornithinimicrobium cryptoxanthini TaxID=2934161 RepID=A0ABY4YI84_9MICO|nr:quinone oxidoreductase [Ornithinimicrobium cryptoxanthini]USQ76337.1 quinone oxidoreductase [Ornithinimicrobium cryptoxanthini]